MSSPLTVPPLFNIPVKKIKKEMESNPSILEQKNKEKQNEINFFTKKNSANIKKNKKG